MQAELIRLETADGKIHYGGYYPAGGERAACGVVLVHGMTGSFIGEIESALPPMLASAGFDVLVANNRGTGIVGAATEDHKGCLADIRAAIDWMESRGFGRVALFGHSKGGVKVAYYLRHTADPRVIALGALSPAESFSGLVKNIVQDHSRRRRIPLMQRAARLVEQGKGDTFISFSQWPFIISAGLLVDHAAAVEDSTLENLKLLRVPVLAACGSLELDWCGTVAELRRAAPEGFRVEVIDGADHVYAGKERALADLMIDWMRGLLA